MSMLPAPRSMPAVVLIVTALMMLPLIDGTDDVRSAMLQGFITDESTLGKSLYSRTP